MKYLLDTNICVYLIRGKSQEALQNLAQHSMMDIGISSITLAELQFGVHKSNRSEQNQQALEQFLVPLTTIDFDHSAAITYGQIRAYLEGQGSAIGSLDTLIAAHALSRDLTLVTNNTKEFSRVPGLLVEDWTAT